MRTSKLYVSNYIAIKTTVQDVGVQHLLNSVVLSSFANEGLHLLGPLYIENAKGKLHMLIQTLDGYDLNNSEYTGTKQEEISVEMFIELLDKSDARYIFEVTEQNIMMMEYNEKNSIK